VDDERPIHIESKVTTAGARADPGDHTSSQWTSTNRIVRGPGHWSRLAGVVATVGLLAGGLLWWANDGDGNDDGGGEPSCGVGGDRVRAARIANVLTRRALTVEGRVADLSAFRSSAGPIVLGPTAVLKLDPREEAPDAAGRCVIRTVPAADLHDAFGEPLVGANMLLTLDDDGDVARIVVRSAADDSELVVKLGTRVPDPQAVTAPDSGR
jgi:hypothetical protein